MRGWLLRGGIVVLTIVPVVVWGLPAAVVLLLLAPVAAECCREADERIACCAGMGALAISSALTLGGLPGILACAWCAACVAMTWLKKDDPTHRGLIWAGLCAAMTCVILVCLVRLMQGSLYDGIATAFTDAIAQRKDAADILARFYQMGAARLEQEHAALLRLFGKIMIAGEVRNQLLYSLRDTVALWLQMLLPQVVVGWIMLTGVLTMALPDVVRRRFGRQGKLPPFQHWTLPDAAYRHLNVLVLGYVIQLLTDQPVLVTLGSLCGAAFRYAYMILGLAVLEGTTRRMGSARFVRRLWMVGCVLFAPFVLMILGVMDRRMDLRHLRRSNDEGGYEQ